MSYIDLTFSDTPATVTKKAHQVNVTTRIILKVPREGLTVMRLTGERAGLESMIDLYFKEPGRSMHKAAIKDGEKEAVRPKDLWLYTNGERREVLPISKGEFNA